MPTFDRGTGNRKVHNLVCRAPHEAVEEEMEGVDVDSAMQGWVAPPSFQHHPVVQRMEAEGKPTIPLALFLDAVQYANKDSMLVVTVTNLLSEKKHVIAVVRKRIMCGSKASCGCRGWCSLWPVWKFVRWSLEALARGQHPDRRHNTALDSQLLANGWREGDELRAQKAGTAMKVAGAILQIRADWGEMATRLGVANWSTIANPCFLCSCTRHTMFDRDLLKQHRPSPWPASDSAGYDAACTACEIVVNTGALSDEKWKALKKSLDMDVRKDGRRGMALKAAWPDLGLKKGDRVEPSDDVPDWQLLQERKPERMTFWRQSKETAARHRNPLFSEELGTHLTQAFTADVMHTWCLGLHQQYVAAALWAVVASSVFVPITGRSKEEHDKKSMHELRKHLTNWYRRFASNEPKVVLTKVHDLSLDHIGTAAKPLLRCKAHETLGLLRFLADQLPGWQETVKDGQVWAEAGKYLLRMWLLLDQAPVIVPDHTQEAEFGKRLL